MDNEQQTKKTEIYCAVSVSFERNINIMSVSDSLHQMGIYNFEIHMPKYEPIVCFDIAIVKNEPFWYLDEALTKMFNQVDNCMSELKEIIRKNQGIPCIDIAFYQYGTYPALEFSGENMKKIRYLEADISIDPF